MDKLVQDKIQEIYNNIQELKIQGATNVAHATLEGMRVVAESNPSDLLEKVESVGFKLSEARQNEPLARNAVKYVLTKLENHEDAQAQILEGVREFEDLLAQAKTKIKQNAIEELKDYEGILTHCHSSTVTASLIELAKRKPGLTIVSTETRPLFQGRITARELVDAGVKATQIVDSAAVSFIVQDKYLPVEAVLIGADEILPNGDIINKVGSFAMAIAARHADDEIYIATTLLKVDLDKPSDRPQIEIRAAKEIWEDAPEGLNIINPSFEVVPSNLITGYITEAGVITKDQIKTKIQEIYPWA